MFVVALMVVSSVALVAPAQAEPRQTPEIYLGQIYEVGQQTLHDVAVTDIQASSSSVSQGNVVSIDVTVQNLGTEVETFDLNLRDDTSSQEITTISLTLGPGQASTVGFPWDTSAASPGSHQISAVATLNGDQDPGNDSQTLASPIEVKALGITLGDGNFLEMPDASFGFQMQAASITTRSTPATSIFIGVHDASLNGVLTRAAVTTQESPLQGIFVANADATFHPSTGLQDPFGQSEIQGTVHLEGNVSSLGAYVQVGPNSPHFVEHDGSFRFLAPSGTFDILIDAPGYVPVRVPNTQIDPGEVLNLPELTLPFGDANGDGKIDILDLSIAASNFGGTVVEVAPP